MTADATFDVVGIGNAIVDVIARAEDDFLVAHGLHKGGMTLIDETKSSALYEAMGSATIMSGGSAANTMAGLASLGGRAAFIGKVRDDDAGHAFRHDIQAAGVHFPTPPATEGATTARAVTRLAQECGVEMPLTAMVAALIAEKLTLAEAVSRLMARPLKQE